MDVILFGIQGSGKGTQGKIIAAKHDMVIFDTGSELRRLASEDSPLAQKVRDIMQEGRLVPTSVVMEIIENFIKNNLDKSIVFDGIPRSMEQAEMFDKIVDKYQRQVKGVYIHLTYEEAVKRLTTRRMCPECKKIYPASYKNEFCENCDGVKLIVRSDDNIESIEVRLKTYMQETIPVIEHYKLKNILTEIEGDQMIDKVSEDILQVLN